MDNPGSISFLTWWVLNPLLSSEFFNGQAIRHCKIPFFIFPFDIFPFIIKYFYRKKNYSLWFSEWEFPYDLNRSDEVENLPESQRELHVSRVCDEGIHVRKRNPWSNSNSCMVYLICLFSSFACYSLTALVGL